MKKILLIAMMLVLTLSFVACKGEEKTEGDSEEKNIEGSAADIAKKVVDDGEFVDEVVEIDMEMINQKLDIDGAKTKEAACYYGTGDSANIVYVAIFNEEADAKDAKDKFATYLDELKTANENYDPEELDKIEDATVVINKKYAIMVISDDNEKAQKAIDSFKK